ncbi:hypothetical protein FGSG_13803 [Fusarium graminearum PH-1]|uniref:hypothetical protein n=1 Tax=Gibberella zeae (strain ATCC MYA-4620 / CBS 123657 / FGSC 9075 / NRRL 31084 / PH-1) TaxID=229533 RepID=UPI00021F1F6A|nr:hypothetical protein FGSG_13803 [Fusarium graminearum PH-1]ESU17395.1 hypothetical protein FGSG_13803 [Fusarium graminearum PH-1]|eukprot:XP_011319657.1 hypothetical protein FGSG_13803 [Fusarium graminearum PH-1]
MLAGGDDWCVVRIPALHASILCVRFVYVIHLNVAYPEYWLCSQSTQVFRKRRLHRWFVVLVNFDLIHLVFPQIRNDIQARISDGQHLEQSQSSPQISSATSSLWIGCPPAKTLDAMESSGGADWSQ